MIKRNSKEIWREVFLIPRYAVGISLYWRIPDSGIQTPRYEEIQLVHTTVVCSVSNTRRKQSRENAPLRTIDLLDWFLIPTSMVHLNGIFVFLFKRAFQRCAASLGSPRTQTSPTAFITLTNLPNKTSERCVAVMAPSGIVAWECGSCTYTNEGNEPGPCIMCRTERPIRYAIVAGAPTAATARTTTVNRREHDGLNTAFCGK